LSLQSRKSPYADTDTLNEPSSDNCEISLFGIVSNTLFLNSLSDLNIF